MAYETDGQLREALAERHRSDPLENT